MYNYTPKEPCFKYFSTLIYFVKSSYNIYPTHSAVVTCTIAAVTTALKLCVIEVCGQSCFVSTVNVVLALHEV